MPQLSLNINREQLAQFLPDHETIVQFENLFTVAEQAQTNSAEDAIILAGSALAKVNSLELAVTIYWKRTGTILSPLTSGDSLSIDGASTFNTDFGDNDFIANKNTAGQWLNYDAGTDILTLDGTIIDLDAPADSAILSTQPTGGVNLAISTTKYVDDNTFWDRNGTTLNPSTSTDDVEWSAFKYLDATTNSTNTFAIGVGAGASMNGADDSVLMGYNAGTLLTSGAQNVAIGAYALSSAITASNCTAIGINTLRDNLVNGNLAIGKWALQSNTTGSSNIAIGDTTLRDSLTGNGNIAIGGFVLNSCTGANNIGLGSGSLNALVGGASNVAIGPSALNNNVSGDNNIAIGGTALRACLGSHNLGIGSLAGYRMTTGTQNTVIGNNSFSAVTTGSRNTAIGYNSLKASTNSDNTAVGRASLNSLTTGNRSTSIGTGSLADCITGSSNSAIGYFTLGDCTGERNTAVGTQAASLSVGIDDCVFLGYRAGYSETSSDRLHIANNQNTTLIYGEFDTPYVEIRGSLGITEGLIKEPTRVTTTYTILVTDNVVFGNTDSAGFTATLPTGINGQTFRIVNTGTSGNVLTIAPNGAELLLGVNSSFALNDGEALEITWDGDDGWY